jgi:hypothetical protein
LDILALSRSAVQDVRWQESLSGREGFLRGNWIGPLGLCLAMLSVFLDVVVVGVRAFRLR